MARREDIEGISGGRFVQPAADRILPATRTYGLQGGRFVQPAADRILPPTRTAGIQIDWENSYHFGGIARMNRRG